MKDINPARLTDFAREFFVAVDAQDAEGLRPYITDDIHLQMANMPPADTAEDLIKAFMATEAQFSSIRHEIQGIWTESWSGGDVVSVEATVHYVIATSGEDVSLPVTSTLRLNEQGKVADYRIFIDPAPAFG